MENLSKMNNDERLNTLRETALELQEIGSFNPPFRSKGKTEEQVINWLKEASPLLEPGDKKNISAGTEDVLSQLGFWPFEDGKKIEVSPMVEDAEPLDIESEIEEATTLKQLKDIAKVYDEFKGVRSKLSSYKTAVDLKDALIEALNPEPAEPKVTVGGNPEKEEEKPEPALPIEKPKITKVKSSYSKNQAMFDAINEMKTGLTKKDWAKKLDDLYVKKGGVSNPKGSKAHIDVVLPTLVLFGTVEETEVKGERTYKLIK